MENRIISSSIKENMQYMSSVLPIGDSYDVVERQLIIGDQQCALYFVNGLVQSDQVQELLEKLLIVTAKQMPESADEFSRRFVPYTQVDIVTKYAKAVRSVLSGICCLFVDGYDVCLAIDCRSYPARSVDEPEQDKALRGPRDGFVENIVINTALIRRRIRDPKLIMEMTQVGGSSGTDVSICYMEDRARPEVLEHVRVKIKRLQIDELKMSQQTLADLMMRRKWYNPFPKYKFTERPDTAAACIYEGKVVIIVDNSPSALVLPTSILDMIEEANDYYFPKLTALYLKTTRVLITFATVFLIPVFLLLMQNPQWLPHSLEFISIKDKIQVPLVWQFLIWELAIDGLRLASLTTPSMLSTPLSVIAGIVMGQFSVKSGWFNSEVMLYMAFTAIANYTQPNFELGYALKFMRLMLLLLTAAFDWIGLLAGSIIVIGTICFNKTITGRSYLKVKKN